MSDANREQRQYLEDQKKMFDQFEREKKKKENEQNSIDLLLGQTQSSGMTSGSRSNMDDLLDIFSAPPPARSATPRSSNSEPLLQFTYVCTSTTCILVFRPTIRWEPISPAPSMSMTPMGQSQPHSAMLGAAPTSHVPPPPGLFPTGQQQFGMYGNNMPARMPYSMLPQVQFLISKMNEFQGPSMQYPH